MATFALGQKMFAPRRYRRRRGTATTARGRTAPGPAPTTVRGCKGEKYYGRVGKQIMVDFQNAGDFMPSDE